MTIFRVVHNNNYTTINNFICKDKRLSWKAKGIWLYAFSRRDDWVFHLNDLINQSTDGRDSVRNGLIELEECGYLIRDQKREKSGKFDSCDWQFYETPQELKESLPKQENPSTVKAMSEKRPLVSTDIITNTVVVGGQPPMINSSDCGKLSKDEVYSRSLSMKKDWSAAEIEVAYQKYSSYKQVISDHMALIDGIIKKIRINNQNQEEKKCKTLKKSQIKTQISRQNSNQQETKNTQKEPEKNNSSEKLKKTSSEEDTSETPLAKFWRLHSSQKKY